MIIIKIGGNCVSPKNIFRIVDEDVVREVAITVKELHRRGIKVIVVHGGGAHAHTPSRCYGVTKFIDRDNSIGLSLTKVLLKELEVEICKIFLRYGVPVLPFDTCSLLRKINDKHVIDLYVVEEALNGGYIPIIHGDITYINDGAYIVSSDDLMYILSLKFRPRLAIFTIRERGIINKDGKTITVLSADDLTNIIDLRCEKYVDVTGGLLRKLEICFKIAKICDVYVCYYDHNTLLNLILNSKCDNCTKIVSNI